jgi:hypothetical protein
MMERMNWVGHVPRNGENRKANRKSKGTRSRAKPGADGMTILKWIPRKQDGDGCGLD